MSIEYAPDNAILANMSDQQHLDQLRHERERAINRVFYFVLEIVGIFLIPAVIAALVSKQFATTLPKIILLGSVFVLSWLVLWARFKPIKKRLRDLDEKIKQAKESTL